jgi:hypothetical protein
MAESQSKIANISSNSRLNSKKLSDTEKGLGGNPLVKKSEAKISLDCPCDVHGTILQRLVPLIL